MTYYYILKSNQSPGFFMTVILGVVCSNKKNPLQRLWLIAKLNSSLQNLLPSVLELLVQKDVVVVVVVAAAVVVLVVVAAVVLVVVAAVVELEASG